MTVMDARMRLFIILTLLPDPLRGLDERVGPLGRRSGRRLLGLGLLGRLGRRLRRLGGGRLGRRLRVLGLGGLAAPPALVAVLALRVLRLARGARVGFLVASTDHRLDPGLGVLNLGDPDVVLEARVIDPSQLLEQQTGFADGLLKGGDEVVNPTVLLGLGGCHCGSQTDGVGHFWVSSP